MSGDGVAWVVAAALPPFDPSRLAALVWIGPGTAASALAPTAQDREDAARHAPAARSMFLARRALLRRAVGQANGMPAEAVVVAYDADGRPTLQAPDGTFVSSSSRDGWVALAVARAPVGVDIEVIGAAAEPAWAMLHPRERTQIAGLPPADRWPAFLALWTAKEAYLKATGVGLRHEPSLVDVEPRGSRSRLTDAEVCPSPRRGEGPQSGDEGPSRAEESPHPPCRAPSPARREKGSTGLSRVNLSSEPCVEPGNTRGFALRDGDAPVATRAAMWFATHAGPTRLQAACVVLPP